MDFKDQDLRLVAKKLARDVRTRLDASGHRDLQFEDHWIMFSPAASGGHELSCLVPLGACLQLPLKAIERRANGDPHKLVGQFAAELAKALPNARSAADVLERYISGIRRSTVREVVEARKAGADIQLADVSPKPTYAGQLGCEKWRDAASNVAAVVTVRRLDFALRPDVDEFTVDVAGDVPGEIARRRDEQLERQARVAELRARGADLEVDMVTLRILAHFRLDAADLLRRARADQLVDMTVEENGRPGRLILVSSDGRVESTLELEGLPRWCEGRLELTDSLRKAEHPPRPGYLIGPAAEFMPFRGLVVNSIEQCPGAAGLVHVHNPMLLFDGLSGRTWSEERQAA